MRYVGVHRCLYRCAFKWTIYKMYERDIISIPWRLRIVRLFMYCCVFHSHFRFNLTKRAKELGKRNGKKKNYTKNFLSENPQFAQLLIYYLTLETGRQFVRCFFFLVCHSPLGTSTYLGLLNFKDSTRRFASFECTDTGTGDQK